MTDLPATMTAIRIRAPGGPEVLETVTRPLPVPGPGELLLRVAAAGVNRPDILERRGLYPKVEGMSDVPGLEVAGTVVAVGEAAGLRFPVGSRVVALLVGGGYAEYVAVREVQCLPPPPGLDEPGAAASLPETWFTVWTNLVEGGRLQEGERVLIHGGASGIGVAAIQLALGLGARVAVTAGGPEKVAACLALGAHLAIDYKAQDFVAEVRRAFPLGVDVVLDMVGGDYVPRNLACLAPGGRHVSIAVQRGAVAELPIPLVMAQRLILTGSTLRPRSVAEKGRIARALEAQAWPMFAPGHPSGVRARPVLHARFPLAQAADAHRALEAGDHVGKFVLDVSGW